MKQLKEHDILLIRTSLELRLRFESVNCKKDKINSLKELINKFDKEIKELYY